MRVACRCGVLRVLRLTLGTISRGIELAPFVSPGPFITGTGRAIRVAQFLAICRASTLAETRGVSPPFSSHSCNKRSV